MKKSIRWKILLFCLTAICLMGCTQTEYTEEQTETQTEKHTEESESPAPEAEIPQEEETTDDIEIAEDDYYYASLSETEKLVYEQVYRSILNRSEITVSTLSTEELDKVFACVMCDHPEIFYVTGYIYTTHSRGDELVSMSFVGDYQYDEAECSERMERIDEEAQRILGGIAADASDFDKIKYVFDTLVCETEYVEDSEDNQNICSVFLNHESTCQGYAKATQYLLNLAGIRTTFVNGTVDDTGHAWNLVMADGAWYYLDTTWGDVDYQSQIEDTTVAKEVMAVNYDYFLISSDKLYETHTPNRIVPLPDCIATEDNYYVHEGLYLTGLDAEALNQMFQKAYERGEDTLQFQCANASVYEQVSEYLLEEQHIFDFVNATNSVSYIDNPATNTFCFWL
jgi:hypothetical protein